MSVWYQVVVTVLTAIGFIFAVLFVIDYTRLSKGRWRKTELGVLLMLGPASLGLIMGFVLTAFLLGQSTARQIVGTVLWSLVVITLVWWHRVMRRAMKRKDEPDKEVDLITPPVGSGQDEGPS